MRNKITILIIANAITTTVLAQGCCFPGKTIPIETAFTTDSLLFSELLSEFSMRCQQYDTLFPSDRFYPVRVEEGKVPLDAKYEKMLMMVPFFKSYPAFRIDCPNGYVLGIFNYYPNRNWLSYLDILSFDLHGRMVSRFSWAESGVDFFPLENTETDQTAQILSSTKIVNGEISYEYIKRSFIAGEATFVESAVYRYKIQDDATLKLLSVEPRLDF